MARAGYVPQLFSLRLPNPDVVYELLRRAGAHALVFDPAFESIVVNCPIPAELAVDVVDEPQPRVVRLARGRVDPAPARERDRGQRARAPHDPGRLGLPQVDRRVRRRRVPR